MIGETGAGFGVDVEDGRGAGCHQDFGFVLEFDRRGDFAGKTIALNHGIAGAVVSSGTALLVRSARDHAQHDHSVDAEMNHITRTLLALPIQKEGQVIGVVELLNPFGSDTFTLDQQQLSTRIVSALAGRL